MPSIGRLGRTLLAAGHVHPVRLAGDVPVPRLKPICTLPSLVPDDGDTLILR